MSHLSRIACTGALGAALFLAPMAAQAESTGNEGLIGAGSALATLVYGPVKLLYAAGGSIVAGLAWIHSGGDNAVVQPILDASLRGDYVITPAHLRRQVPVEFVGRDSENRALRSYEAPPAGNVSSGPLESEEIYRDGF